MSCSFAVVVFVDLLTLGDLPTFVDLLTLGDQSTFDQRT